MSYETSGPPEGPNYDTAATLDEFQEKVVAFAYRALEESAARRDSGESNFTVEYFIDRSNVRANPADGSRVPLNWFQDLFYETVNPVIPSIPDASPYADYCTLGIEQGSEPVDVQELMHYAIIVESDNGGEQDDQNEGDVILLSGYRNDTAPGQIDPAGVEREKIRQQLSDKALFSQLEQGDPSAREKIAKRFLPLAHKLAHVYRNGSEPLEDLEQVASIGLLKAIERFDSSQGFMFSTFAVPTIKGELKRYFRDHTWDVHVPRSLKDRRPKVQRAIAALEGSQGSWTPLDIARKLNISEEEVVESLHIERIGAYTTTSLDTPLSVDDGESTLHDITGDQNSTDYDIVIRDTALEAAIDKLSPDLQKIVRRRLEGRNQKEIGEELGYSQMHVSRLLRRATERLSTLLAQEAA